MNLPVSRAWAVTVLLASVGCGGASKTASSGAGGGGAGAREEPVAAMKLDFVRSGSRLTAMGYSSNEARVFRTFHDEQLDADCDFASNGNGTEQRCVPSARLRPVFTDEACTEPAGWAEPFETKRLEVGTTVSTLAAPREDSCPGEAPQARVAYRVTEQLSEEGFGASSIPIFEIAEGTCRTAAPIAKVTPAAYRLVPIPEAELVKAEPKNLDMGDGLRLVRLVAEDGAELNVGMTDERQTACELQLDGECVPEPIARPGQPISGKFWQALNADCTQPAFWAPYADRCGSPTFGVDNDGHALEMRALTPATRTYGWGMVPSGAPPYACIESTGGGYPHLHAPGKDLTGSFPTAGKLRRGSGPLHVNWYSAGKSELLPVLADWGRASPGIVPTPEFVDDDEQACQVKPTEDGKFRCIVFDDTGHAVEDESTYPEVTWGPF